ncbi:MAG: SGNH/GDSL hydrolase family protein [Proteobacteria bacterium]|nr:SGNH/GDSL hydrolase family protein [Pseudomonadota bacterium]
MAAALIAVPAAADQPNSRCGVPPEYVKLAYPLPRVARLLRDRQPLKIVAIGSSSTEGVGASSSRTTYPSQLQIELQKRFPASAITVINKGKGGEIAGQMQARLERDVLASEPQLAIWQTGTNSALHGDAVAEYSETVGRGVDLLRRRGVEVMLMSQQYSPAFEALPRRLVYMKALDVLATRDQVPLVLRHQIMEYWITSGQFTGPQMVNPDGLHMTDQSYHCLAVVVAEMIAGSVKD